MLSRISLGLDRLSGDSFGAFKNQFGSGSFRVKRVLSRISLGLDRLSGDS